MSHIRSSSTTSNPNSDDQKSAPKLARKSFQRSTPSQGPVLYVNCKGGNSNESRQQFSLLNQDTKEDVGKFCTYLAEASEELHQKYPNLDLFVRVVFEDNCQTDNHKNRSRSRSKSRSRVSQSPQKPSRSRSPPNVDEEDQREGTPKSRQSESQRIRKVNRRKNEKQKDDEQSEEQKEKQKKEERAEKYVGRSILDDPALREYKFKLKRREDESWLEREEPETTQTSKKRTVKTVIPKNQRYYYPRRKWTDESAGQPPRKPDITR